MRKERELVRKDLIVKMKEKDVIQDYMTKGVDLARYLKFSPHIHTIIDRQPGRDIAHSLELTLWGPPGYRAQLSNQQDQNRRVLPSSVSR